MSIKRIQLAGINSCLVSVLVYIIIILKRLVLVLRVIAFHYHHIYLNIIVFRLTSLENVFNIKPQSDLTIIINKW